MLTVGVDFAAQAKKTAACVIRWTVASARVEQLEIGLDDAAFCAFDDPRFDRVGVDCPFGWPTPFVEAITAHHLFEPWPGRNLPPDPFRRTLRLRRTDEYVKKTTGLNPLSVSASLLGVTAMRLATLLDRLAADGEGVDRAGTGRFVEVYPAAALKRWELPNTGYKTGTGKLDVLSELMDTLHSRAPWLELPGNVDHMCRSSDHAFDALISALVARAAALDLTDPPPADAAQAVRTKGWIHLPPAGSSLETLVSPD